MSGLLFLAFLTSLDYFVLISALAVFLAMIDVVYTAYLSSNHQLEKACKIDRQARWIAPVIYFVMTAETLHFRIWFYCYQAIRFGKL